MSIGNNKKGFSLVELIVTIAIMAVMTAVLTPALLSHVEKSRMRKDEFAMGEVVNAVQTAAAQEDVFNELMQYKQESNVSCYIDDQESELIDCKKVLEVNEDKTARYYTYTNTARIADEKFYETAGNMTGLTITFRPENNKYIIKNAVLNQFVKPQTIPNGDGASAVSEPIEPETKPVTSTIGIYKLGNMTADKNKNHYLCSNIEKVIGNEIPLSSHAYRNSEFTVFITMAKSSCNVYGQFDGTNLPEREYDDTIIPETPETNPGTNPGVKPTPSKPEAGGDSGGTITPGNPDNPDQPTDPNENTNSKDPTPEKDPTKPNEETEKGNRIPAGGHYYTDITSDLMPKKYDKDATYVAGDLFPTPKENDVYRINGYEMRYGKKYDEDNEWEKGTSGCWYVTVVDKTKKEYKDFPHEINGIPIISLENTFKDCENMEKSPILPKDVIDMESTFEDCESLKKPPVLPNKVEILEGTFEGCTSLEEAPRIPSNVTNIEDLFEDCINLSGPIQIDSNNIENFEDCFDDCGLLTDANGKPIKDKHGDPIKKSEYEIYIKGKVSGELKEKLIEALKDRVEKDD